MKNIYLLISILGTQFLCASSLHALNLQNIQNFKDFVQDKNKFSRAVFGKSTEAELQKMDQERKLWDQAAAELVPHFDEIVQTETNADEVSYWLIHLAEVQYVLALEAFAKIYTKSDLKDRVLFDILHAEGVKQGFLRVNYRNKHIQNFCKLLIAKMNVQNPLLEDVKRLCSGESLASTINYNLETDVKCFDCKILSRDDWSEEFQQWGPPYEVQAAQIQKCIDQFRAMIMLEKEPDPAVMFQKVKPLLKELLKQLKILSAYKQTENKGDWKKLVLLFKELKKNIFPDSQMTEEQQTKVRAYVDSHSKEKEELTKLVLELVAFTREANDLQEGVFILATEEDQAKREAEQSSSHGSKPVPIP